MARDCVSLRTNTPSENGSGEAIHNWNIDQAKATYITILADRPCGRRPPVSDSATSCRISSSEMSDFLTSF